MVSAVHNISFAYQPQDKKPFVVANIFKAVNCEFSHRYSNSFLQITIGTRDLQHFHFISNSRFCNCRKCNMNREVPLFHCIQVSNLYPLCPSPRIFPTSLCACMELNCTHELVHVTITYIS
jgi:hypothetical protein